MACHYPIPAWRTRGGSVVLHKEQPDSWFLRLPCGGCLGCRTAKAKEWALRCRLELQSHESAVFATLTYDDHHCPPTLERRHLQLWLKRFRKERGAARAVRFFASGEYGDRTGRPHYHAILFGASTRDRDCIEATWGKGLTHSGEVTPASIAYVAGYTSKKIGWQREAAGERVDPTTGEVYVWQPPFIQMSRRPGIGGYARQWTQSWRLYAVDNGYKLPVPRYLHQAWLDQATPEEKEELLSQKQSINLTRDTSETRLLASEQISIAKQHLQSLRRKL